MTYDWLDEVKEKKRDKSIDDFTSEVLRVGNKLMEELDKWGDFECERCGVALFKKTRANGNQKYCRECAREVTKKKHREYMRRKQNE